MEGLAPPLQLLVAVKSGLESGNPVRTGIQSFLRNPSSETEFKNYVSQWLFAFDHSKDPPDPTKSNRSPYRRMLLQVLHQGLKGQATFERLCELEKEVKEACELELKADLDLLPYKLMLPLLLLQFPAFLILLLGPLVQRLILIMNQ